MDWATILFGSIAILVHHYAVEYKKLDLALSFPSDALEATFPRVETYDFIVVGAGIAGCVVGSRLSENPNVKVLVLEAGGNPPPETDVPAFAPDSRNAPEVIYDYESLPQRNANNVIIKAPVGKLLGGTGSINYMFFNRGSPHDFDLWANITGDASWRYDSVLGHFKNLENYNGEFSLGAHHGAGGPLTITSQSYAPGLSHWYDAGREKRFSVQKDPNGPQSIGFSPVEYNKINGKRIGPYQAFLKPFESTRPNLKIIRYAEAKKILLDENNKAYGLVYEHHGVNRGVLASKEIILSAGAYGTPILLMKSGIGSSDLLSQANIETKINLPSVGQNLQDHPLVPIKILVTDKSVMFDPSTDLNENTVDDFLIRGTGCGIYLYDDNNAGPLSSTSTLSAQGFVASSVAVQEGFPDWADIQFSLYSQNFPTALPNSYPNESAIFMYPYLGRPKSRGWVTLDPRNINGPPIIDFNVLHDIRDIQIFTEAIKLTLDIFETTNAYQWVGASYSSTPLPACSQLTFRSDSYWECYIRNTIVGGNHPSGACRMGAGSSDSLAVVDSKLRVIGAEGLRVADASIMPVITNANIAAAVFMIGEKAAADIKSSWGM